MNFIKGTFKLVMALSIVAIFTTSIVSAQNVNIPLVPRLSLTGDDGGYETDFYPDGRIWLPTAQGEPRQFLLPVFMNNNWFNYWEQDHSLKKYIPNPIKSFKFSLMYDESVLQAESVEILPPEYMLEMVEAEDILARNFNFETSDVEDDAYWKQIDEAKWNANKDERELGRRFTIVGTSSQPLPNSDQADRGRLRYNILLFVRFTIIADVKPGQDPTFISKKPVYVDNREILYNDMDATTDRPIVEMSDYPIDVALSDYPGPSNKILTGMDNEETSMYNSEPYRVGSIAVHFFSKFPEFELTSNFGDNPVVQMVDENNDELRGVYSLYRPITVDSNSGEIARISIKVYNKQTGTRMMYPNVTSDNEWLWFKSDPNLSGANEVYIDPKTRLSRADIPYIDNGLLGAGRPDPVGDDTQEQGPIYLEFQADPSYLAKGVAGDDEKTGSYEGWATFQAPFAEINPVKLRIPFTFIKNPEEMDDSAPQGETGGINLSLFNSDGVDGDEVKLLFGTGRRATIFAESLYGEEAYATPLSTTSFEARFFPVDERAKGQPNLWENGFRDVTPDRYTPRTHSRDIRPYREDITTHTYHCKFNSGGADKYPVILEWDISEFPEGALIYLRDAENGKLFPAIDMRNATNIGGTRYSYTFNDARITEFFIEYSVPQTFEFVDEKGEASIKPGWNMLSMPLVPMNNRFDKVYPNALNIPQVFTLNQWQDNTDFELTFGEGYAIKYSSIIDKEFIGTKSNTIPAPGTSSNGILVYPTDRTNIDPDDKQKDEYGGWNLVGSISYPTHVDGVEFLSYQGGLKPDKDFTDKFGYWKYEPSQGYKEVRMLKPGFAYWIKTNRYGYYTVEGMNYVGKSAYDIKDERDLSTEIEIRDNAQNVGTLYVTNNASVNANECQLPPCPPAEVFDVRFEGHTYVSTATEDVIKLQGVTYPATIFVKDAPADYIFSDAVTGKVFGSISKGFTGNITIEGTAANAVAMSKVAAENAGEAFEVFPNPVKATSTVNFTIPVESYVSVKLYDALGNEVATVKEGNLSAGNYSEALNTNGLTAGNYMCRITYGDNSSVVKVTVIK